MLPDLARAALTDAAVVTDAGGRCLGDPAEVAEVASVHLATSS